MQELHIPNHLAFPSKWTKGPKPALWLQRRANTRQTRVAVGRWLLVAGQAQNWDGFPGTRVADGSSRFGFIKFEWEPSGTLPFCMLTSGLRRLLKWTLWKQTKIAWLSWLFPLSMFIIWLMKDAPGCFTTWGRSASVIHPTGWCDQEGHFIQVLLECSKAVKVNCFWPWIFNGDKCSYLFCVRF